LKNKINKIKEIRESKGFSQESVAHDLNITQQAYSRIEKNPESTTLKRLKELSKIFEVSLASLIGEEDTYIQQNFQQQGGYATSVINMQGNNLTIEEKRLYEEHIKDLRSQLELLKQLIKQV
jgi:transcriptional regulator with XRE-family HTH domain